MPKTTRGLAYPTNTKATAPAASSSFLCGLAAVKLDKKKFESSQGKVIFTLWHHFGLNFNFEITISSFEGNIIFGNFSKSNRRIGENMQKNKLIIFLVHLVDRL